MTVPSTYANHAAMHQVIDLAPVIAERGMGSLELLVLLVIARHINHDSGITWLSYETIARESICCRRTAFRVVQDLVKGGLLTRTDTHLGQTNRYQLVREMHSPSAGDALPPVQEMHYLVQTTTPTSASPAPVVVMGVEKGSSHHLNSEPENENRRRIGGDTPAPTSSVAQVMVKPKQIPATPTISAPTQKDSPARRLANRYYVLLGSLPVHARVRDTRWTNVFGRLLTDYTYDDLLATMNWAIETDTFWPDKLVGVRRSDPVEYFSEKLDQLISGWKRYKLDTLPKPTRNSPTPAPVLNAKIQTICSMFKYE